MGISYYVQNGYKSNAILLSLWSIGHTSTWGRTTLAPCCCSKWPYNWRKRALEELETLDEVRLQAQQNLELYKARMTRAHDHMVRPRSFQIDELVLVRKRPITEPTEEQIWAAIEGWQIEKTLAHIGAIAKSNRLLYSNSNHLNTSTDVARVLWTAWLDYSIVQHKMRLWPESSEPGGLAHICPTILRLWL